MKFTTTKSQNQDLQLKDGHVGNLNLSPQYFTTVVGQCYHSVKHTT